MSISHLGSLSTDLKTVISSYLDVPTTLFFSRTQRSHQRMLKRKKIYRRRIERDPLWYFSYFISQIEEYKNSETVRHCIAEIANDMMNEPNAQWIVKVIAKVFLLANFSLSLTDKKSLEIFERQAYEIVVYVGMSKEFYTMFSNLKKPNMISRI